MWSNVQALLTHKFIVLLSFSRSLETKCVSLNNEPCMIRSFLIDLNPVALKFYPSMISSDTCSGRFNSVNDLSMRISAPSKPKDLNVKVVNMITNRNEAKNISKTYCKCKFISTTCNLNKK